MKLPSQGREGCHGLHSSFSRGLRILREANCTWLAEEKTGNKANGTHPIIFRDCSLSLYHHSLHHAILEGGLVAHTPSHVILT